ncbi:MAG: M20/M25/M40 family metallo-hydrolase, partial [Treponemataceae bacterium]
MKEAISANDIPDGALDRFRAALRIRTDWPEEADGTGAAADAARIAAEAKLTEFQDFLVTTYPAFHAVTERYVISPFAVAYRWPGTKVPGTAVIEPPVLLLSHYDVVPVERSQWSVDPFGAELKDGYVWARGTLDTKNSLICALEAAEKLAETGFKPKRDIWFAFGGDEERSGQFGARKASAFFKEKKVA